jgi:hypothetical protein
MAISDFLSGVDWTTVTVTLIIAFIGIPLLMHLLFR